MNPQLNKKSQQQRAYWLLLAVYWSSANVALAQSDNEFSDFADVNLEALLNSTVVTVSQKAESLSEAPAVIEVITREQLLRWNVHTLNEALAFVAGTDLVETYVGYTTVNMRGIIQPVYNSRTLLLLDGMPLYEAANGSFHLEQIPISAIERIEIIRGPGAILYGTNAFAGVISIVTRKPQQANGSGRLWGGLPLAGGSEASGGHGWDKGFAQVSAQFYRSPQWTAYVAADETGVSGSFPRGETFTTFLARAEQQVGDNSTLTLQGGYLIHEKAKWSFLPNFAYQSAPNQINASFAEAGYRWQQGALSIHSSFAYLHHNREIGLGVISAISPEPQGLFARVYGLRTSLGSTWQQGPWLVNSGAQYMFHRPQRFEALLKQSRALSPLQATPIEKGISISDLNIYSSARVNLVEKLSLGAGLRYNLFFADAPVATTEAPSEKHTINPQLSVVARLSEQLTGKLLYGRAFRLPTLYELYTNSPLVIMGEPDLRPEIIDTIEAAIDLRPVPELSLRLDGFMNFTRDLVIRTVPVNGGGAIYSNGPGDWIRGVELSLRWLPISALDILLTGGFQEGYAKVGGSYSQYLSDIQRLSVVSSLTWLAINQWLMLTPQVQYIGRRAGLDAATLLHAHARSAWKHYSVTLSGKNLTDERYALPEQQRRIMRQGIEANQPLAVELVLAADF